MGHIVASRKHTWFGSIRAGFTYSIGGAAPVPPIPAPVASMSYDDFNSYTALVFLNGLNSGSNEWDNTTPLAAYFSRQAYNGVWTADDFSGYSVDTVLSASLVGSGSNEWSSSYDYYGREAYYGIKATEYFEGYSTGSTVSGSNLGSGSNLYGWSGSWDTRETKYLYGIKVYDDFSTYTLDQPVSGSDGYPYEKWNNTWSGSWDSRLNISGSV